jgi:uncharacterized phage protein (TIGR02218 family)
MKTFPAGLQAHLDSGATTLAWCWRVTRADGAVFGFTDHDRPLILEGTEFEPDSGLAAAELRHRADLSVDAQDAQGALSSERITETDILDGRWDNAAIEVWRVNWSTVAQRLLVRRGNLGQVRRGRSAFTAEIRSLAHLLDQQTGRVFQASCDAAVGDACCGVNLASPAFSGNGAVLSVEVDRTIVASGLSGFAAGLFGLGRLEWTGGVNAGRRAEVARHQVTGETVRVVLAEAPVRPVVPGDLFILRAGCDKRLETCRDRFGNVRRFRGFPHIPGQDAVLRYATRDGGHEGEVL